MSRPAIDLGSLCHLCGPAPSLRSLSSSFTVTHSAKGFKATIFKGLQRSVVDNGKVGTFSIPAFALPYDDPFSSNQIFWLSRNLTIFSAIKSASSTCITTRWGSLLASITRSGTSFTLIVEEAYQPIHWLLIGATKHDRPIPNPGEHGGPALKESKNVLDFLWNPLD